jgi:hypothetical protein
MEEFNSVPIGSPVGQDETAGFSHDHRANQQETRTGVYDGPERGGFSGLGKRVKKCKGFLAKKMVPII